VRHGVAHRRVSMMLILLASITVMATLFTTPGIDRRDRYWFA
jgi:hypothetical protein